MLEDLNRSYAISYSTLTFISGFVLRSKRAVAGTWQSLHQRQLGIIGARDSLSGEPRAGSISEYM